MLIDPWCSQDFVNPLRFHLPFTLRAANGVLAPITGPSWAGQAWTSVYWRRTDVYGVVVYKISNEILRPELMGVLGKKINLIV